MIGPREGGPAEYRARDNLPQEPEGRIVLVEGEALAAFQARSGRGGVPGSTWCAGGQGRSAGKGPWRGRAGVGGET